jgi:hypothetical protein
VSFLATDLILKAVGHDASRLALYELVEPFRVSVVMQGDGGTSNALVRVAVPRGFVTNFASIPWFFRRILPPDGPWQQAAVVHDYLYSRPDVSRFLADAIFRELMPECEVCWWQRVVMFYAVRLFGGRARKRGAV